MFAGGAELIEMKEMFETRKEKKNSSKIANQRNGQRLVLCHLYAVCISHNKFDSTAVTNSPHVLGA